MECDVYEINKNKTHAHSIYSLVKRYNGTMHILRTTVPHYVPPPSSCLVSKFCNHTWTSECGQETLRKDIRMFLDLCDMHEYNCDEKKNYKVVDIKECPKDDGTTTEKQTTIISTIENPENASTDTTNSSPPASITTSAFSTTESTTFSSPITISTTSISTEKPSKCTCLTSSTSQSSVVTSLNNTTESPIITSPTTIISTSTNTEQPSKCTCSISSTTQFTVATSLSTTSASVTPTTISITPYTECTRDAKPSENAVTIQSTNTTAATQSTEKTETTTSITENTETNNDTDDESDITTDYDENATEANTIIEEIEIETVPTRAPALTDPSVATCSSYPGDCDRPHSWETTPYGEKRDFFQILRERFGNKVKILRATTHWPRGVLISNQGNTFYNGRHGDSNFK